MGLAGSHSKETAAAIPRVYHRFLINDRPAETARDWSALVGPASAGGRTETVIGCWRLLHALRHGQCHRGDRRSATGLVHACFDRGGRVPEQTSGEAMEELQLRFVCRLYWATAKQAGANTNQDEIPGHAKRQMHREQHDERDTNQADRRDPSRCTGGIGGGPRRSVRQMPRRLERNQSRSVGGSSVRWGSLWGLAGSRHDVGCLVSCRTTS
jgi:hypothetical protein